MTVMARWRGLQVDVVDVAAQTRFWSLATGLTVRGTAADGWLAGPTSEHTLRLRGVAGPATVKNRLHLDVDCPQGSGLEELIALGATVLAPAQETGLGWSVLADPEGQQFCAFERPAADMPSYRLHGVVIDSADPTAIATWWGGVLGTTPVVHDDHGYASLERVAVDERMTLDFVPVPEPRTPPNRVRWLLSGDLEQLIAAGACHLAQDGDVVRMSDPDGNEFDVVAGLPD